MRLSSAVLSPAGPSASAGLVQNCWLTPNAVITVNRIRERLILMPRTTSCVLEATLQQQNALAETTKLKTEMDSGADISHSDQKDLLIDQQVMTVVAVKLSAGGSVWCSDGSELVSNAGAVVVTTEIIGASRTKGTDSIAFHKLDF